MLSIGKLAGGSEGNYLRAVASGVEDHYLGSGEAPGRWVGAGSVRLGLVGRVTPEGLRAVLDGRDPDDLAQIEETIDVLSDPQALADIREADAAYSRGDVVRGVDQVRKLRT